MFHILLLRCCCCLFVERDLVKAGLCEIMKKLRDYHVTEFRVLRVVSQNNEEALRYNCRRKGGRREKLRYYVDVDEGQE